MSLVLAIEPDAAQAAVLRDIARSLAIDRLDIVATNDEALRFLLRETPDVLLVTALQAPREEEALLVHLRALPGAAHLQTLAIPRLRAAAPAESSSLRFRLWRRADAAPGGCDPNVFREQVRAYLAWAYEARSQDAADVADVLEPAAPPAAACEVVMPEQDDSEEWVEIALDRLTDGGTEGPPYVRLDDATEVPTYVLEESPLDVGRDFSPAEQVGPTPAELEARHAEELARVQAEAEALRAAAVEDARLRVEAEAREAMERTRLEAEADARAAMERMRLEAEAEAREAVERTRLQAEVEAREAVERARIEAEAEARTRLAQELAAVRQHAEQAFAETLSRVREEAAETLAAEVGRAREEAAVLQQTEMTRVESEAEARLHALLEEARAAAEQARQTDLADAKWRAEEVRAAAAREARAAAEVVAASTLNAEMARVRADAEQRVAEEVARVRAEAEQQRAAELEVLRAQIAEVKKAAAKRAATVIVAPPATRELQRPGDSGQEAKWTVPAHLAAARKNVSPARPFKKEPSQAPSQASGSYYSLWGSDRSPASPSVPRGRPAPPSAFRRWALPIAATLVLVTSGGVAINVASFDPMSWAKRSAPPAAVQADAPIPATPVKPPRAKRTVRPRPAPAQKAPALTVSPATLPAAAPVSPFGSVHVTAPSGTMIVIEGAQVGQAPVSLSLPVGKHEVVGTHPELGKMRQSVDVKPEARVIVGLESTKIPNPESHIPKNDQIPTNDQLPTTN